MTHNIGTPGPVLYGVTLARSMSGAAVTSSRAP